MPAKLSQKDRAVLDGFKLGLIGPDRAKAIISELISFLQEHEQDEETEIGSTCRQVMKLVIKINRKLQGVRP